MRLSQILIQTLRDDPADAEIPSHKLLARGGFSVKIAAGVYVYAPLMWRVVKLGSGQRELLKRAADRWRLSARTLLRVLKVARTIADLAGSPGVTTEHVAEALQLRCRDRA